MWGSGSHVGHWISLDTPQTTDPMALSYSPSPPDPPSQPTPVVIVNAVLNNAYTIPYGLRDCELYLTCLNNLKGWSGDFGRQKMCYGHDDPMDHIITLPEWLPPFRFRYLQAQSASTGLWALLRLILMQMNGLDLRSEHSFLIYWYYWISE